MLVGGGGLPGGLCVGRKPHQQSWPRNLFYFQLPLHTVYSLQSAVCHCQYSVYREDKRQTEQTERDRSNGVYDVYTYSVQLKFTNNLNVILHRAPQRACAMASITTTTTPPPYAPSPCAMRHAPCACATPATITITTSTETDD